MPEEYRAIKYKGGHAGFPKEMNVRLIIHSNSLEIPEFDLVLPFRNIQNIEALTEKKITAGRIALTGLIGLAWKKKKEYMVITYEDEAGMIQNPVFDAGNRIKKIQPLIYQRIIATKREPSKSSWQDDIRKLEH